MNLRAFRLGNMVFTNDRIVNTNNSGYYIIGGLSRNRIGRVILQTGYLLKGDIIKSWASCIEPIPLSEDLLFKLGFKKEKDEVVNLYEYNLCANNCFLRIGKYSNTLGRDYNIHIDNQNRDSISCTDIGFLHQLQNAVFDATGEELNVNELLKE